MKDMMYHLTYIPCNQEGQYYGVLKWCKISCILCGDRLKEASLRKELSLRALNPKLGLGCTSTPKVCKIIALNP